MGKIEEFFGLTTLNRTMEIRAKQLLKFSFLVNFNFFKGMRNRDSEEEAYFELIGSFADDLHSIDLVGITDEPNGANGFGAYSFKLKPLIDIYLEKECRGYKCVLNENKEYKYAPVYFDNNFCHFMNLLIYTITDRFSISEMRQFEEELRRQETRNESEILMGDLIIEVFAKYNEDRRKGGELSLDTKNESEFDSYE